MLTVRSVRKAYIKGRAAGAAGDQWLPWVSEPRCEYDVKAIAERSGHELGYAEWKRNFLAMHGVIHGDDTPPTVTFNPEFIDGGGA